MPRAIILATGSACRLAALSEHRPPGLVPFLDRPFIQHVVERLVGSGFKKLDLVLSRFPEQIENLLGDGSRWGAAFQYHLVREGTRPFEAIRVMPLADDEVCVLAHELFLPICAPDGATPATPLAEDEDLRPAAWLTADGQPMYAGWSRCRGRLLRSLSPALTLEAWNDRIAEQVKRGKPYDRVESPLDISSPATYLDSLIRVLDDESVPLLRTGTLNDAGIRLSRNIVLHPTVELRPPVRIGNDCRIGRGVRLGPHAVVGDGCMLDTRCCVERSAILPGSYIGERLDVCDSIVERNRVINVRLGGVVDIADTFIVGAIETHSPVRTLGDLVLRSISIFLLVATAPVLLAAWGVQRLKARRPAWCRVPFIKLPASGPSAAWRVGGRYRFVGWNAGCGAWDHFMGCTLPGLVSVAGGELALVGLPPRTADEIAGLPEDWKQLYLNGTAGLFTETEAVHGIGADEDERYACEALYVATRSLWHDLWIISRCLRGSGRRPECIAEEAV